MYKAVKKHLKIIQKYARPLPAFGDIISILQTVFKYKSLHIQESNKASTHNFPNLNERRHPYLPIGGHSKQRLLSPNQLHWSEGREGFARSGDFHLGAFNPSELPPVVMPPPINGSTAASRQSPVVWSPTRSIGTHLV